ncbi:hypothetical protein NP233_g11488 [Leucocoprinus birnbaumii]|uniref:Uncharacterized protein n=1 Tax=Leucocoprinus birnbaumii TaxID=56174 RepID=A0AAD5YQX0_9AGAR|nr:hypothetical protein NP233_g11488 [Leucocoprinus birnbaumii]
MTQLTEIPHVTSFATYASRNPRLPTIEPAPPKKKSVYDKQSIEVSRVIREQKQNAFVADLEAFHEAQDNSIKVLASKYNRKFAYMSKLLKHQSFYRRKRGANLWNAKVAFKAKELNEGKPPGERAAPSAIREAVKNDPALANMTDEEKAALKKKFDDEQKKKKNGARINNKAATLDYNHTVDNIENEMKALENRTGINAFGFFTRGHVNDTMQPAWVASSPGCMSFLPETMQTTAGEMGRHFELWACTKTDTKARNELGRLQSECSEMIVQRLREITNRRNAMMSYQYYETDIQARYDVELKGWPEMIEFRAPGKITTMYEIRTLHAALCSGQCYWKVMAQGAVAALAKKLQQNPVKKTRQSRKRKNDENVAPAGNAEGDKEGSKRKRRAAPKSRAMVGDDE